MAAEPKPKPKYLYKILFAPQWKYMEEHGISPENGSMLDRYTHCVNLVVAKDVENIAKTFFPQLEHGILLQIKYKAVRKIVRWEEVEEQLVARVYAPIPQEAVANTYDFTTKTFGYAILDE